MPWADLGRCESARTRPEPISADAFVGSGDNLKKVPARVEVTGELDGWDISVNRVHDPAALPTLALLVAISMALGRRKFLPPFATWYAANLFAIVPLRNILPGAPPPGSWIDQAIVQWVLIALVTAMSLYIFAWVRQGE